jgi:hypothetical protein
LLAVCNIHLSVRCFQEYQFFWEEHTSNYCCRGERSRENRNMRYTMLLELREVRNASMVLMIRVYRYSPLQRR